MKKIFSKLFKIIKKLIKYSIILSLLLFLGFIVLNQVFPLPKNTREFSAVILAENGNPLRPFADENGVWRYPVKLEDVSPRYIEALLGYEDRWFYSHPGVNPLAIGRAFFQMIYHRKLISGGSTITMQVARLLDPHAKTLSGKTKQMFRAFQLEWYYTKDEILTIYLNIAPYGGPIEGIQAASYSYLGKPAKRLSYAESALLAVLPQSPTRFRPDLHQERATRARNKVLKRLKKFGIWTKEDVEDAFMEKVPTNFFPKPSFAPLLSRRFKSEALKSGSIKTTINYELQRSLEEMVRNYIRQFPDHTSAALLVVENKSLKVKAYLGSADFADNSRFGHIDMITGLRSPGSTLKPFLYGIALDDGLIHSQSLLADAPQSFDGYKPGNFMGHIHGPVSAAEALQKSLNIPAVFLIDKVGAHRFSDRLGNAGINLKIPGNHKPNLSIILGGASTNLESLVSAYSAFAREGISGKLRFSDDEKLIEKRVISKEAAWIIKNILQDTPRPGINRSTLFQNQNRQIAWKTGTSYGFRDAWAIGVTDEYTIGVWIGRPDNTPSPGQYGAVTAAPLLFDVVDSQLLPKDFFTVSTKPETVISKKICWPLGTEYSPDEEELCHIKKDSWTVKGNVPPTIPTDKKTSTLRKKIWINSKTGKLVNRECDAENQISKEIALWPGILKPWVNYSLINKTRIPGYDKSCKERPVINSTKIKIIGLDDNSILKPPSNINQQPEATLKATGGEGSLFWIINGKLHTKTNEGEPFTYKFIKSGENHIAVIDAEGNHDRIKVTILD